MPDFHDYCEVIFWNFERKNNVVYNFNLIEFLIEDAKKSKYQSYYYKPIIVIIMSIIECSLYDFLWRVKQAKIEGIHVTTKQKNAIESTNISNALQSYLDICKKQEILGEKSSDIYARLQKHIEYRNRIHIQNRKRYSPSKEQKLWTKSKVINTGNLLREIFTYICKKYPRPDKFHSSPNLNLFPAPWNNLT